MKIQAHAASIAAIKKFVEANYDKGYDFVVESYDSADLAEILDEEGSLHAAFARLQLLAELRSEQEGNQSFGDTDINLVEVAKVPTAEELAPKAPTYARDIAGLLAACGPQELHNLRRECITQTIGYTESGFTQAILDMVMGQVIYQDAEDKAFDLIANQ